MEDVYNDIPKVFFLKLHLVDLLFVTFLFSRTMCLGEYDRCQPWSACTVMCGGGTRTRLCKSCFWSTDKYFTEGCNQFCFNGGTYIGGQCNCPAWVSGTCCEGKG